MYKLLIYGIILITNINFVLAETTLNCGIAYSVEQIREIAFNNVPMKISSDAIQNKLKYKKRFLFKYLKTTFSDNTFGRIDRKTKLGYYYTEKGDLYLIQVKITDGQFRKYARYDINGNLDSIILDNNKNEQYVFDINKKLIAHWIGKNGYDENGELFGTRD